MTDKRWRFPPELRTMAVVPRWSVVWTLQRDTVANHTYFVAFYAHAIARLIDWDGDLGELLYRALVHDAEECISGDIVSPIKDEIVSERANAFLQLKLQERMPFVVQDLEEIDHLTPEEEADEAWRIIKAADKLDALIFLLTERRLGNGVVATHLPRAWARTEAYWRALPAEKDVINELWNTVIVPAIKAHETEGGAGLL